MIRFFQNFILLLMLILTPLSLHATAKGEYLVHDGHIYLLQKTLGAGAFGTIYQVLDIRTGKEYAYKEFTDKEEPLDESLKKARIEENIKQVSDLASDRIIEIQSVGEFEHYGSEAHKLRDGEVVTFKRHQYTARGALIELAVSDVAIQRDRFLLHGNETSEDVRVRVLDNLELLRSVSQAILQLGLRHKAHRDIKPANILIMKDGRFKVGDVDLVSRRARRFRSDQTLVIGTPLYMAPEVYVGRSDFRTDLFSLGITMAELVLGQNPMREVLSLLSVGGEVTTADIVRNMASANPTQKLETYVQMRFSEIRNKIVDPQTRMEFSELADRIQAFLSKIPAVRVAGSRTFLMARTYDSEGTPSWLPPSVLSVVDTKDPMLPTTQVDLARMKSCRSRVLQSSKTVRMEY